MALPERLSKPPNHLMVPRRPAQIGSRMGACFTWRRVMSDPHHDSLSRSAQGSIKPETNKSSVRRGEDPRAGEPPAPVRPTATHSGAPGWHAHRELEIGVRLH